MLETPSLFKEQVMAGSFQLTMSRISAGIVMYRLRRGRSRFSSSIRAARSSRIRTKEPCRSPGEVEPDENLLECAKREFTEELGVTMSMPFIPLTPVKQKGDKVVHACAFAGNCDPKSFIQQYFLDGMAATVGATTGVP